MLYTHTYMTHTFVQDMKIGFRESELNLIFMT